MSGLVSPSMSTRAGGAIGDWPSGADHSSEPWALNSRTARGAHVAHTGSPEATANSGALSPLVSAEAGGHRLQNGVVVCTATLPVAASSSMSTLDVAELSGVWTNAIRPEGPSTGLPAT